MTYTCSFVSDVVQKYEPQESVSDFYLLNCTNVKLLHGFSQLFHIISQDTRCRQKHIFFLNKNKIIAFFQKKYTNKNLTSKF